MRGPQASAAVTSSSRTRSVRVVADQPDLGLLEYGGQERSTGVDPGAKLVWRVRRDVDLAAELLAGLRKDGHEVARVVDGDDEHVDVAGRRLTTAGHRPVHERQVDAVAQRHQGAAEYLGDADGLCEDRLQVGERGVIAAGAVVDTVAVSAPRDQTSAFEAEQVALDLHEARPGEAGELPLVEVGVGSREKQPQQGDKRGRGEQGGETAAGERGIHMTTLLGRLTKNHSRYTGGLQSA